MIERLEWLLDNWERVGFILGLILTLLTGKKWYTADKALGVVVGANEGLEGAWARKKVKGLALKEGPNVRGLIANHAARTDPRPAKQPSIKESLKSLAPNIARQAAGALMGGLFKRWEK